MRSGAKAARQVETRTGGRCEYCRMHQALQGATFHLEHILPQSRGGGSDRQTSLGPVPAAIYGSRIGTQTIGHDLVVRQSPDRRTSPESRLEQRDRA
jgi:hypothetical protein